MEPAVTFLRSVDVKMRAKAFRTIELLKQFGPELPMPHARKLVGHDLYELRVKLGSKHLSHVLLFRRRAGVHRDVGIQEEDGKTDQREIMRAERLRDEYIARRQVWKR